jgi:hypothetical protein
MLLLSAGMGCNDGPEPIHFQRLAIKDDVVCRDRHLKAPILQPNDVIRQMGRKRGAENE